MFQVIILAISLFDNCKEDRQISIMGVGDPSLNIPFILEACEKESRVSIATIMPKVLPELPENLKIHYSLHTPDSEKRKKIMPSAKAPIMDALMYLESHTGQTEIHYTLIKGINDSEEELLELCAYMSKLDKPINIKFLAFRKSGDMEGSDRIDHWKSVLSNYTTVEFYDPPGRYVQGSCGQFTKGLYQENPDTSSLSLYVIK